ncbi:MAG: hypothetical protein U0174_28725 [Polyangiaceae bacterium]
MKRALIAATVVLSSLAASALGACGGGADNLPPPPPAPPPPPPPPVVTATATAAQPEPPPPPPVSLVPGAASPDPATPTPTVRFAAPSNGQVIPADKAPDFAIKLDVKNWQTATGSSHVHLILDNKPYKAIYDTKAPIKLGELAGGEALSEGQHVLVAFPSRANHESVKTKGAFTMLEFFVGRKGDSKTETKKPMLVYSRPKGEYKGENGSHVLIDFQLANVTLAEGKENVTVAVTGPGISGELTQKVTSFGAPLYLDNLRTGSYSLKLELVGADGKVLPGPWNSTTRTIKIDREAQTEDPHAGHGAAPATTATTAAPATAAPKSSAAPKTSAAPAGTGKPKPKK